MELNTQSRQRSIPDDVRKVIDSADVPEKLRDIGLKHGLHLDQIGILGEETSNVMVGVSHPDEFVARIEERLGITTEEAIDIATDVNVGIFLAVRESLMNMHTEEVVGQAPDQENPENTGDRESILAEIENPTPTIHPISSADQTIAGPAMPREVIPQPIKPVVTNNIAEKLAAPVNTPSIKVTDKPRSYATDPYREPIA